MRFFGKKKDVKDCGCGSGLTLEGMTKAEELKKSGGIKVLGTGCSKCRALEASVRSALAELNMDEPIEHVTDLAQIAAYGIMSTPALVVDGKVVSYGKVLNKNEAIKIIMEVRKDI